MTVPEATIDLDNFFFLVNTIGPEDRGNES